MTRPGNHQYSSDDPAPGAQERLEAAERAGERGEALRGKAQDQVNFLQGLRARWGRIYKENHLAELFQEEWRSTS